MVLYVMTNVTPPDLTMTTLTQLYYRSRSCFNHLQVVTVTGLLGRNLLIIFLHSFSLYAKFRFHSSNRTALAQQACYNARKCNKEPTGTQFTYFISPCVASYCTEYWTYGIIILISFSIASLKLYRGYHLINMKTEECHLIPIDLNRENVCAVVIGRAYQMQRLLPNASQMQCRLRGFLFRADFSKLIL